MVTTHYLLANNVDTRDPIGSKNTVQTTNMYAMHNFINLTLLALLLWIYKHLLLRKLSSFDCKKDLVTVTHHSCVTFNFK